MRILMITILWLLGTGMGVFAQNAATVAQKIASFFKSHGGTIVKMEPLDGAFRADIEKGYYYYFFIFARHSSRFGQGVLKYRIDNQSMKQPLKPVGDYNNEYCFSCYIWGTVAYANVTQEYTNFYPKIYHENVLASEEYVLVIRSKHVIGAKD